MQSFQKQDVISTLDDVVELFIHHPGLPMHICNSKHFRNVLKSTGLITKRNLREGMIKKDRVYFEQLKSLLCGQKVGIQIDGGKNINQVKVIGICVVVSEASYCWDIVPAADDTVLTEAFYKDLMSRVVRDIEACGAVVVSVTMDNEASPNAGVRELIASTVMAWLIHNRCYAHTAELFINDLQSTTAAARPAIPILQSVTENVHKIVTAISGVKYLRAAMDASQRDRGVRALKLVKHANTRKWSSSFLMLARFVKLYDDVARMEHFIATGPAPEQGEREAKQAWLLQKAQQLPLRTHCEAVRELLYWIYVAEQTVQKDGASVLHGTFVFEEICESLLSREANHRVPRIIQNDMDRERVAGIVQSRRELLQKSGVYWLSLSLWPLPLRHALDQHDAANSELDAYVTRCWKHWQEHRDVMGLQPRYHADVTDPRDMEAKRLLFIEKAQEDLTDHLVNPTPSVLRAKTSFQTRSQAVAARLIAGERIVKRGPIVDDTEDDSNAVHVHGYWAAVCSSLPALAVIARAMLACCATEAAVERLFSKEGFIHDSYRNRLGHDVLLPLVRSCMNRHALEHEPLRLDDEDESDLSD
jgi:hypothetical protein